MLRCFRISFLPILLCLIASAQQPTSWTSHDKLALTYFFYWYDAITALGYNQSPTNHVTLHPPDSYLSTYSYTSATFFQRELTDMIAAGIDVVLPVYWGDPGNAARWGVPGLQLMVQAEQAMAQAGRPAPKIGMFADMTSLQVSNGGVKPDLTTAAGKSLFYGQIQTFFRNVPKQLWAMMDGRPILVIHSSTFVSAYDQSTFDYVSQNFQQDFGTTPYIIRHLSWKGVKTDAAHAGWPTWYNATFAGDVASVTPGHDNFGVIVPQGRHNIVDRNCGDLYQRNWDQVVSHGARLVLIEDWNELFEGSGISATKEYGRRYIDQTASNIARWKGAANPPPASPSMVWASLGRQIYSSGLYPPFNYGGTAWLTTQAAGHDAMYPDHSSPSYYLYLAADDRFLETRPQSVWVTVEYLDSGNTPWRLEYDGISNPFTATAPVAPQNTGAWKRHTFNLPDAMFQKSESPNTDFRIDDSNTQNVFHYFNRVWVTKSAPYGEPPRMPLLPDIAVQAGTSVDLPLTALDSSGKSVPVSLALGLSFASIQGNASAQTIRVTPSLGDVRSCSDVTGPGITSSPSYIISAVANDPNSLPSSGATTFFVTVTAPTPVIQAVYDAWNYTIGIAPGAWVSISGTSLATGAPQTWNPTGITLPTTLNNVMVSFNGTLAALYYVSSTQINALVPATVAPGPVQVIVQSNGVSSAPFAMTASATLPAVYAPLNSDGSTFFVTAALAGTATLIGNAATDPRVARSAQPGDVLDLYMIGLGVTQDRSKFVTDQVFAGAYSVSAPVTATVGSEPATVLFAGLTSPGLYLVRIAVPSNLAPGPQPISVSSAGSHTRSSLVLMLGPR